jgi:hypothetical protein
MEKYRVTLDAEKRAALERLVSVGKAACRKLTHARVLLLADAVHGEGSHGEDILGALGTSVWTIARVEKRIVTDELDERK